MRNKNSKIWLLALGLLFLVIAVFTKGFGFVGSNPTGLLTTDTDSFVRIPISDITSNAKWYEYDSGGNKIKFFAIKAADGTTKTAFDACDVCYKYKKGYRQEGDYMVCNNCGNRYPIDGLGTENKNPGGCWPGYLSNIIKEDSVLIEKSDLENNRWRSL